MNPQPPTDEIRPDKRAARAPLRAAVALAAASFFLWCAWGALRAGASRMVSDYAARAASASAADASVALAPSDPEAHYARANLLADAGDYAGASRAYEAALGLRPRDYVLWVELGRAREEAGDAGGALEAFRRAVDLAPFYARPRWQLGNALLRAGRREEAAREVRRAAASDPRLYPNLLQTLWHSEGKDAASLVRAAAPASAEETLAAVRFLVKEGAAAEGLRMLRESGADLTEESRRQLVKDLLAAEDFAGAYDVWAGGRGGGGGAAARRGSFADGGFESEARTDEEGFGWRFAPAGRGLKLSLDAESPREGSRSLLVEYAGASEPSERAVSQLLPVEPGARYRLTFSARTREVVTGGPPVVEVVEASTTGARLAATAPLPPATDAWRDFALEFDAPPAGAVRVALRREPCASSPCPAFGRLWLDAFELRRLGRTL
jgi:tetratricopeptide (TPR) repeat protein